MTNSASPRPSQSSSEVVWRSSTRPVQSAASTAGASSNGAERTRQEPAAGRPDAAPSRGRGSGPRRGAEGQGRDGGPGRGGFVGRVRRGQRAAGRDGRVGDDRVPTAVLCSGCGQVARCRSIPIRRGRSTAPRASPSAAPPAVPARSARSRRSGNLQQPAVFAATPVPGIRERGSSSGSREHTGPECLRPGQDEETESASPPELPRRWGRPGTTTGRSRAARCTGSARSRRRLSGRRGRRVPSRGTRPEPRAQEFLDPKVEIASVSRSRVEAASAVRLSISSWNAYGWKNAGRLLPGAVGGRRDLGRVPVEKIVGVDAVGPGIEAGGHPVAELVACRPPERVRFGGTDENGDAEGRPLGGDRVQDPPGEWVTLNAPQLQPKRLAVAGEDAVASRPEANAFEELRARPGSNGRGPSVPWAPQLPGIGRPRPGWPCPPSRSSTIAWRGVA
jgi:hypothetical protein